MSASAERRLLPVLALGVLALLAVVALGSHGSLHGSAGPPWHLQFAEHDGGAAHPLPAGRLSLRWLTLAFKGLLTALAIIAALLIVALVVLVARHRPGIVRRAGRVITSSAGSDPDERQAALREAIVRSLEEVRRDPNARRAIIGAYRLMETTLQRSGLARRPAEAPREYLTRALAALDVGPQAPARLTALYERARFGGDELDLGLRDEAVACLLALRGAL